MKQTLKDLNMADTTTLQCSKAGEEHQFSSSVPPPSTSLPPPPYTGPPTFSNCVSGYNAYGDFSMRGYQKLENYPTALPTCAMAGSKCCHCEGRSLFQKCNQTLRNYFPTTLTPLELPTTNSSDEKHQLGQDDEDDEDDEESTQTAPSLIGPFIASCLVFWLCDSLLGLIAFLLAFWGHGKVSEGDFLEARKYSLASYIIAFAGLVVGVVSVGIAVVYVYVIIIPIEQYMTSL